MPRGPESAVKLYERLMQMQGRTFDAGRFQTSYHILAAALHTAEEMEDQELLRQVEELATSRQAEIDRMAPEHKISSPSAAGRGNIALFTALSGSAAAARGRIAADQVVARVRHETDQATRP